MSPLLDSLSPKDMALLVRLPVRVGFWISGADTTGGDQAAESERIAINTMIQAYAEDYLKSEFVQRLMERTVAEREQWSRWLEKLERVPDECHDITRVLDGRVSPRDLKTFKRNLLDIGVAVAMAFSENKAVGETSKVQKWIRILSGGFRLATPDERISTLEYQALKRLAAAMGLDSAILNSAV